MKKATRPHRTLLIVDDHAIVRHGIAALLAKEKDLAICGEAGTFEEAQAALEKLKPDLLVLDITLKDQKRLGADQGGPQAPARNQGAGSLHARRIHVRPSGPCARARRVT